MAYKQNHANIKEWAANYKGELFDGILCDPPYELGFMGKSWDSSGIAFDVEMWADILKLLKPGGHLLAFSGSRTYHRMAVAIEDAGFEIRDMIEWVYGSGFPKSLNIGKAVDKLQGYEKSIKNWDKKYDKAILNKPKTELASEWEGWGTALKPAHEPCVLARKPLEGTVANNVLAHGTGGLNIDGSRVEAGEDHIKNATRHTNKIYRGGFNDSPINSDASPLGRFPANLIHDGSDEVEAVFPNTGASKAAPRGGQGFHNSLGRPDRPRLDSNIVKGHTDNGGSASRFFYCAKSSKSERNAGLDTPNTHPTLKPLSLTKYLATIIKPPTGGRLLVPFSGSGSEMIGALQAGWEYVEGVELTEEYIPIAEARIKHWTSKPNQGKLL